MRTLSLCVMIVLAACAPKAPPPAVGPLLADPDAEQRVSQVIEAIVTGDPHGPIIDTLFTPGATVIANGSVKLGSPRLAGVMPGGQSAVTSSQVNVRQDVAWATIDYRWFSEDKTQIRLGKATMILTPTRSGTWKVVQMHSSASR